MKIKFLLSLVILSLCHQTLFAQTNRVEEITPQRERVVLKFAKQHHAELANLLQHLKEMDEKKYDSAILELSRTYDRLERTRSRSQERFQTDLALWKIDSRVKLLVARSIRGMEDETRQQIQELLLQRNVIRLKQYTEERDRLKNRLSRIEEQVEELKQHGESLAEQDMERILKTASRLSKNNSRSATNKTTKTSAVRTKAAPKSNKNSNSNK